jgi:hypothetical protein
MSSTMIPDLVVGEVGFGSNFAPEADFYRAQAGQLGLQVADLEAEVAELIRQRNRLRRVLQKCAALSPEISDEKHEVLLQTDPKNLHREQEND